MHCIDVPSVKSNGENLFDLWAVALMFQVWSQTVKISLTYKQLELWLNAMLVLTDILVQSETNNLDR